MSKHRCPTCRATHTIDLTDVPAPLHYSITTAADPKAAAGAAREALQRFNDQRAYDRAVTHTAHVSGPRER